MKLTEGLRVIDITNNYAGPGAAAILAEYGAEVIHVEKPVLGDDGRHYPPIINGESMCFVRTNQGKKSVVLDMKDPRGKKLILDMIRDSDILIESNRPGVMERLGLDYDSVKELNPGLIYCSVSAFGQTGPYSRRPGYDVIAQAYSSVMYKTGTPQGGPTKIGMVLGDSLGTLNAFCQIMCALYYREKTGEGQFIDVSLARGLMSISANFDFEQTGVMQTRMGNHDRGLCPYGVFLGNNDEAIVIGAVNTATWVNLCRAMGREELAYDPDFVTNDKRVANKERVIEIVTEWVKSVPHIQDCEKRLMECGVPCSIIYNDRMLLADEHANACGWITEMPLAEPANQERHYHIVAGGFGLSKCTPEFNKAPLMGEDNYEILGRYGYSREEVDSMEREWAGKVHLK